MNVLKIALVLKESLNKNGYKYNFKAWSKHRMRNSLWWYRRMETCSLSIEGVSKLYYHNGQLKEEGNFKNGKKHGEWTFYHRSGHSKWRKTFKDGEEIN